MPRLAARSSEPRLAARLAFAGLAILLAACSEPRTNLLLITVDTLRRDHLGVHGETRALTPQLDAFARDAVVFDVAFAPAPFTRPSVAALLTGHDPGSLGVVSNAHPFRGSVETLATGLWGAGFQTAAVVSNAVLKPASGLARGFDAYDAELPEHERIRGVPERSAEPTTDAALAQLDRIGREPERPFFLWVHYQDPHGPYTPPPALRERQLGPQAQRPGDPDQLPVSDDSRGLGAIPSYQYLDAQRTPAFYRAGYAAEVHHTDAQIGRLLAELGARGLAGRTLVVFASDHGESLGEDDYWFAHGEYLSDVLVRIPLWIRGPGLEPGRRADVASLLDVLPTVFGQLGLSPPAGLPGRDLFAAGAKSQSSVVPLSTFAEASVPRRGVVAEGWKYVRSGGAKPAEEFQALEAVGRSGAPADAVPQAALRERLRAHGRERVRTPAPPAPSLTDTERRALEALGYLAREPGATPETAAPAP